jgi:hypothetical protein
MKPTACLCEQRKAKPRLNLYPPVMNYTNLDSRLKLHSLSPSFLRRLKRIRANSLKARATTAKKNPPPSSDAGVVAG